MSIIAELTGVMTNVLATAGATAIGKRNPQRAGSNVNVSGVEVSDASDKCLVAELCAKNLLAKFNAMGSKTGKKKSG